MADKNLPHIPIYIGDWERDCNVLSLQAEMAWMKIIFKMHLSGKQSRCKLSAKALQILWKSNADQVGEILEELRFNDICEVREISGGYEFFNRRIEKENQVSEARREAANARWDKSKPDAKPMQNKSKRVQNTDIDNDNDSKRDKGVKGGKEKVILPWDEQEFIEAWEYWKQYKLDEHKFKYKSHRSEQAALTELSNLANGELKTAILIIRQSISQSWKGLFALHERNGKESTNIKTEFIDHLINERTDI